MLPIIFILASCAHAQHAFLDDLIDGASAYDYDPLDDASPDELHAVVIVFTCMVATIGAVLFAAMALHGVVALREVGGQPLMMPRAVSKAADSDLDDDSDECLCC